MATWYSKLKKRNATNNMFTNAYCQEVYEFFNSDFFKEELGVELGECIIFTNRKAETTRIFPYLGDRKSSNLPFGLSKTFGGINYIWINPLLLNNKKLLLNTILHEMIHLYVNAMGNSGVRRYRQGHGGLWTRTAKLAQSLYGHELGSIEQFATDEELGKYNRYHDMRTTKSIVDAYLVKLTSGDLVPVKDLSKDQIAELKQMDIIGIYRVRPSIEQKPSTRVTKFIDWETLIDCIENGIDYETESVCGYLNLRIGQDTETIWVRTRTN